MVASAKLELEQVRQEVGCALVPGAGDAGGRSTAPASPRARPISSAAPWPPSRSPAGSALSEKAGRRHGREWLRASLRRAHLPQLEGFGTYGFPESHAASFALIAYASSWLKCHHPDVFCAALLNAQPMGFYAPAQIVRDARDHGVEVRPVCVNACAGTARWSRRGRGRFAVRLGMRMVRGLANAHAARISRPVPTSPSPASTTSGDAPARRPRRWSASPRPTPSARRSALPGARRSGRSRRCATSRLPLFAAADARDAATRAGSRRAGRDAPADDRGPRGRRGLRPCRPDAARAPGRVPARRTSPPAHRHLRRGDAGPRRQLADHRRARAGAPDAGLRQGRHVHHHRGRDRHRQPDGLAERVRAPAPRHPRPPACSACRAASSARARSSI